MLLNDWVALFMLLCFAGVFIFRLGFPADTFGLPGEKDFTQDQRDHDRLVKSSHIQRRLDNLLLLLLGLETLWLHFDTTAAIMTIKYIMVVVLIILMILTYSAKLQLAWRLTRDNRGHA